MDSVFFLTHVNLANPEENLEIENISKMEEEVKEEIRNTMHFHFIPNTFLKLILFLA